MSSILSAGIAAPNFTLRVTPDQNLTLSDLRESRSSWRSIPPTGVRFVAIK
jgi:hypothetical protein